MLKKLYKYEFSYMYKLFGTALSILLPLTVTTALLMKVKVDDNMILTFLQMISAASYAFTVAGILIGTYIIILMRFYKHFFTSQGYLTFTLPISPMQHFICKFVVSVALVLSSMIAIAFSLVSVVSIIDLNVLNDMFKGIIDFILADENLGMCIMYSISFLLSIFASILVLFTILCIGQLFKNRILASILGYIIYYFASQVINSTYLIFGTLLFQEAGMDSFFQIATPIYYISYSVISAIICILVSRNILTNKLNLE